MDLAISMNVLDDQQLQQGDGVREVEVGQDIVEDSHDSDMKAGQRIPVKKGRGRSSKTEKAADTRTVLGKIPKEGENITNGSLETSVNMNEESQRESGLLGGAARSSRKRSHLHTSQGTATEIDGNNSRGQSDSVAISRGKRRQRAAPSVQAHAERRYKLRGPRSAAPATSNGSLPDPISKSQEENWNSRASLETPQLMNDAVDNQESSANMANELVDDTGLSEEVNETPKRPSAYGVNGDEEGCDDSDDDGGDGDDDDEEEIEHPGEVSVGKKIWTFITT